MSGLYNAVFEINPFAPALVGILGLDAHKIPRLRDAVIKPDRQRIIVYTRTGGPNRQTYAERAKYLTANPHYASDRDDAVDATYAHYEFRIPDEHAGIVADMAQRGGVVDIEVRWRQFLTAMEQGWDTPETRRGKVLAQDIANAIETGTAATNPNVSVHWIDLKKKNKKR